MLRVVKGKMVKGSMLVLVMPLRYSIASMSGNIGLRMTYYNLRTENFLFYRTGNPFSYIIKTKF